jgi:hypothetical protein
MLKRFRLSDASEWIAHDCLDEVEGAQRYLPIRFDPVAQVLSEFWVEY